MSSVSWDQMIMILIILIMEWVMLIRDSDIGIFSWHLTWNIDNCLMEYSLQQEKRIFVLAPFSSDLQGALYQAFLITLVELSYLSISTPAELTLCTLAELSQIALRHSLGSFPQKSQSGTSWSLREHSDSTQSFGLYGLLSLPV